MAFSSLSDARSKVTNPEVDVNSTILYATNALLDSTTVFYQDEAKTVLASAGNYVIPSPQFKSYYVTLDSAGKIVGEKQELLQSTTDISWVDDTIIQYPQGFKVDSSYYGAFEFGTQMSVNSSNVLTDSKWSDTPGGTVKKWQVDYGPYRTDALTNIDLSDMKGYDLKITIGKWGTNNYNGQIIAGFQGGEFTFPIVHIAADPNRATSVGNVNYYFRPDYFYPKQSVDYLSYFRRFPNTLPILDKNGEEKNFISVMNPLLDVVVKDSGQYSPGITRQWRTSKRNKKGLNYSTQLYLKNFVSGTPSNSDYFMYKENNGSDSENIYQFIANDQTARDWFIDGATLGR